MSEGTAGDPRMTSVGITSSGLTGADQAFYKTVHTPFLIILGGTSDIAYENGKRDYDNISALGLPTMLFSKNIGHGGDLGQRQRRARWQQLYVLQQHRVGSEIEEHSVGIARADSSQCRLDLPRLGGRCRHAVEFVRQSPVQVRPGRRSLA